MTTCDFCGFTPVPCPCSKTADNLPCCLHCAGTRPDRPRVFLSPAGIEIRVRNTELVRIYETAGYHELTA